MTIDRSWCAGIVTAAGASSRMGRPKALVDVGGRPLLEAQLAELSGFGQRIVVLGLHAAEIRASLTGPLAGVTVALNPDWQTGRSSSLRLGFRAVFREIRAVLVTGVDQPLDPIAVERLLAAFDPALHAFAVPKARDRRGHPLLLNTVLRDSHLERLADDVTLRDVLRQFEASGLDVPVPGIQALADLNTEEDVARFQAAERRCYDAGCD